MKPSEFLTNIVDFFAVLLPGAIITFVVFQVISPDIIFQEKIVLTETQNWIAFALISYILGGFIFLIGSLLDGVVYKSLREKPYKWIRHNILDKQGDDALERAKEYKREMLGGKDNKAAGIIKWAKANIYLYHPNAAAELHRFEANSKFFRSLIVVFFLLTVVFLLMIILTAKSLWMLVLICFFGLLFSLFSYVDQRYKYVELACIYLIAMHKNNLAGKAKA